MWRSRMFWRLLGTYGGLWVLSLILLGAVIVRRVERHSQLTPEALADLHVIVWGAVASTGVLSLLVALWLARRISQPLQELTHASMRLAAGAYGHKVYVASSDEIGALARTFNQMSENLASQFQQLEQDRQQLRTILSGMVEGVVALDGSQRILFANERAASLLGFQPRAGVGRPLAEVVRNPALQDLVRKALSGKGEQRDEVSWNGPASRSLTVHAARLPGYPASGAVVVLHDTTELRRLERLRQDFVANVSHELKTPLSIIKAYVETLLDGAVEDPQHRGPFLERIAEQSERLQALIIDLLSLARIESGTEAWDLQVLPLEPLITGCLERHQARAEAKNQRLEVVPPADPGQRALAAWADEEAVGQILDNLVDNAVKYTPAGGCIRIHWRRQAGLACIEVEDTGIGIPEQDLPRIFERFYRVDKARSRALGGTGLGLSIVKHLVQSMHGSVAAHSELGRGSRFTVLLPSATG